MPFPIRQHIARLAGLNRTQRAILTLAVELAEHGGKGHCYATNAYLAQREQTSARNVSRALATLRRLGLLVISGCTANRRIVPGSALRPCYASETNEACAAATAALGQRLSRGKTANVGRPLAVDKPGPSQDIPNLQLTTTGAAAQDNSSRAYKETSNHEQPDEQDEKATLRAALARVEKELAAAQKKIDGLQTQLAAGQAEIVTPTTQRPAAHTAAGALRFPTWADNAFRAQWAEWVAYRQSKRNKLSPASLQKMLDRLAAFDAAFCQGLFDQAIASGYTGLVFDDTALKFAHYLHPSPSLYRHANPLTPQSPERGAKPSAHAAAGARTLSAQLRALREHGSSPVLGSHLVCQAIGPDPGQG